MKTFRKVLILLSIIFLYNNCGVVTPAKKNEYYTLSRTEKEVKVRILEVKPLTSNITVYQNEYTGQIKIAGNIKISYLKKQWYEWKENMKAIEYGAYNIPFTRYYTSDMSSEPIYSSLEAVPQIIQIEIGDNKISEENVTIDYYGNFNLNGIYSNFKIPKSYNEKYEKVSSKSVLIKIEVPEYECHRRIEGFFEKYDIKNNPIELNNYTIKEYFITPNSENIKNYVDRTVNNNIFSIDIVVKNKISRAPVTTKINVTCISIPNYESYFKNEFYKTDLIEKAKSYVNYYLRDSYSKNCSYLSLYLIAGAKYKIETFNENFEYFTTTFIANKAKASKTILLVEKGISVRINSDNSKGIMIDN